MMYGVEEPRKKSMDLDIPLLSEALDDVLFHPNCRHRATTYFPNGSPPIQIEGKEEIPLKEQQERKQHSVHIQIIEKYR